MNTAILTAANRELAAQQLPSVATSFQRRFVNSFPKLSVPLSLMNLNLVMAFSLGTRGGKFYRIGSDGCDSILWSI
jgi:hypothetical protein